MLPRPSHMWNSTWAQEYKKFLKSAEWQRVRERVFRYYGKKCYCCKTGYGHIQVHHITYTNYKNPSLRDVVPLCRLCHAALKEDARKSGLKHHALLKWHMLHCKRRR